MSSLRVILTPPGDVMIGDILEVVGISDSYFVVNCLSRLHQDATKSPPDLGVQVSDATRVADRMG